MSQQTVYNGRYELHRRLARGGMADVYLARDQLLDRPVAIKVLFREFATDPTFVERFRREAQAAANLNHANIVAVYDWGEEDGTYFIVMEYVEGRSLADVLRTEGPLHPLRAAEITADIASALSFAHRNGVIHRDVKPGNVIISPTGQVKVTDFGIARAFGSAVDQNLTQVGSVMGTATYFSPEQAQGKPLDPRSDVYSLGVVLYEMLTGRPPFTGESPLAIAYMHVQQSPERPRKLNPAIPAELEAITGKCMAKSTEARYASADDLRTDLRRFQEGEPVAAARGAEAATQAVGAAVGATQMMGAAATAAVPTADGTRAMPSYVPQPPPRRRNGFLVLLLLLLLLLGGLFFALAKVLSSDSTSGTVEFQVPTSLKGRPQAEAIAALQTAGFDYTVETRKNDTVKVGTVIDTDPVEGSTVKVDKGTKPSVKLIVSAGATTLPMPDVVGQLYTDAQRFLQGQGFTNVTRDDQPNDDPSVKSGEVFEQNPPKASEVAKDAPIVLKVSSGPTQVPVPQVAGQTASDAANTLGQAGFKTTTVNENSSSVPNGSVIRTNPAAGTNAAKGSTVTLMVSSGPAQVDMPALVGMTKANADAAVANAGLTATATCQIDPLLNPGQTNVTAQNPQAGQKVDKGSNVSYTYSATSCPGG